MPRADNSLCVISMAVSVQAGKFANISCPMVSANSISSVASCAFTNEIEFFEQKSNTDITGIDYSKIKDEL